MAEENEMENGSGDGAQNGNSYFGAFAGIVDALDAIAQAVAPGGADGGEPPAGPQRPDGDNSYFSSFRCIRDALARVRDAVDARLALPPRTGAFALVSPQAEGGTVALADNAVNDVSLGGGSVAFAFPERTEGFARSFILRLTMETRTEWTLPDGVSFEGDDYDALGELAEGETAALFFSETREDVFLVSRKAARAVVKG